MPRRHIFVSYRREDSAYVAATIREKLEEHFERDSIFMDVDSIPLGMDFRKHLDDAVSKCDVLLAIIGDNWVARNKQTDVRRIDDPADYVRIEVESALRREIPVIPVLVGQAQMPHDQDLPESLRELSFRNATEVRAGRDLGDHLNRLVKGIHKLFEANPATRTTAESATQPDPIDSPALKDAESTTDDRDFATQGTRPQLSAKPAELKSTNDAPTWPSTTPAHGSPDDRFPIYVALGALVFSILFIQMGFEPTLRRYTLYGVPAALALFTAFKSRGSWRTLLICLAPTLAEFLLQSRGKTSMLWALEPFAVAAIFAAPAAIACFIVRRAHR
ncbi:MAG: TIR domain-containing protein [Gemmatimonadaceae bacterium]